VATVRHWPRSSLTTATRPPQFQLHTTTTVRGRLHLLLLLGRRHGNQLSTTHHCSLLTVVTHITPVCSDLINSTASLLMTSRGGGHLDLFLGLLHPAADDKLTSLLIRNVNLETKTEVDSVSVRHDTDDCQHKVSSAWLRASAATRWPKKSTTSIV